MERPPMLMDWLDRNCERGHPAKNNLKLNTINIKSKTILHKIKKKNLNIYMETKRPKETKIILINNKNIARGITIPNFKSQYRERVIKNSTVLVIHCSME